MDYIFIVILFFLMCIFQFFSVLKSIIYQLLNNTSASLFCDSYASEVIAFRYIHWFNCVFKLTISSYSCIFILVGWLAAYKEELRRNEDVDDDEEIVLALLNGLDILFFILGGDEGGVLVLLIGSRDVFFNEFERDVEAVEVVVVFKGLFI